MAERPEFPSHFNGFVRQRPCSLRSQSSTLLPCSCRRSGDRTLSGRDEAGAGACTESTGGAGEWLQLPSLALPDGQNTRALGQRTRPKIFRFTEIGNRVCVAQPGPRKRGVSRSSRTRDGGRWTLMALARKGLQGESREQRPRAYHRCHRRTAKSCGPGARGLCAKSCGDVSGPTGPTRQQSARRRGQ